MLTCDINASFDINTVADIKKAYYSKNSEIFTFYQGCSDLGKSYGSGSFTENIYGSGYEPIRPISKDCYEISKNPNIFKVKLCNSDLIALFFKFMSLKTKFVPKTIKYLKDFIYLVKKIEKKIVIFIKILHIRGTDPDP